MELIERPIERYCVTDCTTALFETHTHNIICRWQNRASHRQRRRLLFTDGCAASWPQARRPSLRSGCSSTCDCRRYLTSYAPTSSALHCIRHCCCRRRRTWCCRCCFLHARRGDRRRDSGRTVARQGRLRRSWLRLGRNTSGKQLLRRPGEADVHERHLALSGLLCRRLLRVGRRALDHLCTDVRAQLWRQSERCARLCTFHCGKLAVTCFLKSRQHGAVRWMAGGSSSSAVRSPFTMVAVSSGSSWMRCAMSLTCLSNRAMACRFLRCYGYRRVILDDHLRTLGRPGRGVVRPGRYASGARSNCKKRPRTVWVRRSTGSSSSMDRLKCRQAPRIYLYIPILPLRSLPALWQHRVQDHP